jgi:hypothetical protein
VLVGCSRALDGWAPAGTRRPHSNGLVGGLGLPARYGTDKDGIDGTLNPRVRGSSPWRRTSSKALTWGFTLGQGLFVLLPMARCSAGAREPLDRCGFRWTGGVWVDDQTASEGGWVQG